jgi:hypothetical protein
MLVHASDQVISSEIRARSGMIARATEGYSDPQDHQELSSS